MVSQEDVWKPGFREDCLTPPAKTKMKAKNFGGFVDVRPFPSVHVQVPAVRFLDVFQVRQLPTKTIRYFINWDLEVQIAGGGSKNWHAVETETLLGLNTCFVP